MSFKKEVVVDASQHLIGRLASVIAKQLLNGQHVTVVRCERLEQTGGRKSMHRIIHTLKDFLVDFALCFFCNIVFVFHE